MAIGIVSDLHGSLAAFVKAYDYLKHTDYLILAGDILYHGPRNPLPEGYDPKGLANFLNKLQQKIFVVRGNCDAEVDETLLGFPLLSPFFLTEYLGKKILTVHDLNKLNEKYFNFANIIIHGHTHIWQLEKFPDYIILNPGSISLPKGKDPIPTVAIIDQELKIIDINTGNVVKNLALE
ncbi:phosphodiesterase [Carboxydothermus pertinax]|uniref:Phosphoesterase n=1 Tax=Carboxydothermus pertinax TaxID=870242 RepID=A0A1L8CXU1_9THEO|nr:phosphodiesterase [Carboxydothermus pertinax]GAV23713.1 phosphodiesterase [Carboxydothermus pertinax]